MMGYVGAFLAALGTTAAIGFGVANALHEETRTCTVDEKDRQYVGKDRNLQQRVYTDDCGVLEVGDALFAGHFNSADTWNAIDEGETYRLTTRGYRIGFFSMFPNIVDVEEVEK